MSDFQIGDRIIVTDRHIPWAHEQEGVILATYPPRAEHPHSYECIVWHRPLQLRPDQFTLVKDE